MHNKLSLSQLKVESFVTNMEAEAVNTVKGGSWRTACGVCPGPAPTQNADSRCICK